ncbi:alpha/beta fold hydrolase [Simplicispira psychrophila]|uniref:alpha/beta fold hydrolase n=1 Tax=Simplicispira psychrophila TaxID=80882 RepID=UPI0004817C74|nr:alpha/beta hydrolase [Simplicispira psychrophila]
MYQTTRPLRSEYWPLRNLKYHVSHWGDAETHSDTMPLVLLHGWMDVGASFQFIVDAFSDAFVAGRPIWAPDWRGFGRTQSLTPTDHYIFADYLADLDQLLDHYAPNQQVDLVGHSMGGNIAMMYAGARPERVRRLINLEGFGLPATQPEDAPARYAQWMDELKKLERGEIVLKPYDSAAGVAQRLMKTNPRLSRDKALWLAQHWASPNAQGQWTILGDAAHKIVGSQLFRVDETLALYGAISAPTLSVHTNEDSIAQWWKEEYSMAEHYERLQAVPDCRIAVVENAGHMVHHDQPQAVAALIEAFLQAQ